MCIKLQDIYLLFQDFYRVFFRLIPFQIFLYTTASFRFIYPNVISFV